jgi:hypothetical protein
MERIALSILGPRVALTRIGLNEVELNEALYTLCRPPFDVNKIQQISSLVRMLDGRHGRDPSSIIAWHYRPRTYAVLQSIDGLGLMDAFIQHELTDFHLPYSEETLPEFVADSRLRQSFIHFQSHVLTSIRDLELSGSQHLWISGSADGHFKTLKLLGLGGNG